VFINSDDWHSLLHIGSAAEKNKLFDGVHNSDEKMSNAIGEKIVRVAKKNLLRARGQCYNSVIFLPYIFQTF
jgi:hypothetical protein